MEREIMPEHIEILFPSLSVEQVAEILKIAPRTVQDLCRKGRLGGSRPGRRWLIPRESLEEYLKVRR
jgi:excisionase family DNA binding protein